MFFDLTVLNMNSKHDFLQWTEVWP